MQRFIGRVIGTAMQKTAKVCVERLVMHPKYPKLLRVKKNYLVHDENQAAVVGDIVAIQYLRRLSKRKSFILTEIIRQARSYVDPRSGQVYTSS
jgi:small subunit ribosomal protein S17